MATAMLDLSAVGMPVVIRLEEPVTDDVLMEFSSANHPFQVERNRDGEIVVMTPVGGRGSTHQSYVIGALWRWAEESGGGEVFSSQGGFHLADGSCLMADAAWVSAERWGGLSEREQEGFPPLAPDFVIEVRSHTDSRRKLDGKMALWMENGVQLGWLVDPIAGEVVVYRAGEAAETLERPEVVVAHATVAGFALRCERLWSKG